MEILLTSIIFVIAGIIILLAGTRLTSTADALADRTGLGEALLGAMLLGGITSLPGIITSVVAAAQGYPHLAVSNAIGGIAAQTVFLAIADSTYRRTNLEHAAASLSNIMQGLLLLGLLALTILGTFSPTATLWGIHPLSLLLLALYIGGFWLISSAKKTPMWHPVITKGTIQDEQQQDTSSQQSLRSLSIHFIILGTVVALAGYGVAQSGISLVREIGLSESLVGTLFTSVVTSLPELVVSLAAVKKKALTLAVSNIIGGNAFDVLFVAFADVAYREGSIFHAVGQQQLFLIALTAVMISVLLLGLLVRQEKGIGGIGWESFLILLLYSIGNTVLFVFM